MAVSSARSTAANVDQAELAARELGELSAGPARLHGALPALYRMLASRLG